MISRVSVLRTHVGGLMTHLPAPSTGQDFRVRFPLCSLALAVWFRM